MTEACKVYCLAERARKPHASRSRTPFRSALRVHIAHDGAVDFDIESIAAEHPDDRLALVLASLVMCMRLTRQALEEMQHG
ncbi:hypothetical protein [Paraburkholderia bannensis]|uniref:hypothetical protein n=1 Tax=Paraburkholderia bannensis TaxID=765414 RepID=UPI002AC33FD7|nr:hypothetical protein [Paraburkholderia bannensis]